LPNISLKRKKMMTSQPILQYQNKRVSLNLDSKKWLASPSVKQASTEFFICGGTSVTYNSRLPPVFRIRIRMQSVNESGIWNPDPVQKSKNDPQELEKVKKFYVTKGRFLKR
jgi:hypothetical protein